MVRASDSLTAGNRWPDSCGLGSYRPSVADDILGPHVGLKG
jgi:hypothetical protein